MSNARERITFFYDRERDSDIHDWIMSLPERGKTSQIQKAIRFYLEHNSTETESGVDVEPKEIQEIFAEMKRMKNRILTLEETVDGYSSTEDKIPDELVKDEKNEEKKKLVDGKEILRDLGK